MMTRDEIIMNLTEIVDQPTTDGIVDGISQKTIREALKLLIRNETVKWPHALVRAEKKLEENYQRALNNPSVYSPLAWALYHTWREVDAQEEKRRKHEREGAQSGKA